jgi:hypothetical protein
MVQLRVVQHLHHRMDCARFGVVRAIYDAFHSRVHHRARAHWTRLNCNKQFAVSQAMVTQVSSGLAKGDDFSVGGGVGVGDVAVPASADNLSPVNNDCAYGDLASLQCALGGA